MATLKFLLSICALQFFLASSVLAEKIVLDLHSDHAKNWLDVSCLYNDDYNDFWVYGYPVTLTGNDDVYPNQRGFWTAGTAQRCEIHYFLGDSMPFPKSMTVGLYLKGNPEILVSSRHSLIGDEDATELGSVSDQDGDGWFETTIDLTDKRAMVFNLTLISLGEDILLLDKIVFDLGDDVTTPTEPPPTTTALPIEDDVLILDTNSDYWVVWRQDCHYIDDYGYLWAYGCPYVEPKEEDDRVGYWNHCTSNNDRGSCNLRFIPSPDVIQDVPDSITIRSYVEGNAKINITARNDQNPVCAEECSVVGVINDTQGKWSEVTFPITVNLSALNYGVSIEMTSNEGGIVLLDRAELRFPEGSLPTPPPPDATTTTTPSPKDNSAPGIRKGEWHVTISLFLISSIFALRHHF